MRVLFVNSRKDAGENPGGDNVQLSRTRAVLEQLGLTVEQRAPDELEELPDFDLAHVFNIQIPESARQVIERIGQADRPIVLSPVYWEMTEHWAEMALSGRARWRTVAQLVGRTRARKLYVAWQRLKSPAVSSWRTQRLLLKRAARILPNSQTEGDLLCESFALGAGFRQRVDVIPNGIEEELYRIPVQSEVFLKEYGIRDFVLQVGSINPAKNQLALIEAMLDMDVPLVFIGQPLTARPDYFETCQALGRKRGNVLFVGHLRHEELPGIYALAKVHVLPSWRETPGLASLEAAAAGCNVVTTSIGSTRDYFGKLAWYCHPGDVGSIRRAVTSALEAPRSSELRQRVLQQFTWQRAGEATLKSYSKVVHSRCRQI